MAIHNGVELVGRNATRCGSVVGAPRRYCHNAILPAETGLQSAQWPDALQEAASFNEARLMALVGLRTVRIPLRGAPWCSGRASKVLEGVLGSCVGCSGGAIITPCSDTTLQHRSLLAMGAVLAVVLLVLLLL